MKILGGKIGFIRRWFHLKKIKHIAHIALLILVIALLICTFLFISIFLADYILNCGESSSQSSQNISSGHNMTSPSGPFNHNTSNFFATVLNWDTDRLADFLQARRSCRLVGYAGIRFGTTGIRISSYDDEFSRIARYVRQNHDGFFHEVGPNYTRITDELLSKLRGLKENVPSDFL